jgi:hypothetical protein
VPSRAASSDGIGNSDTAVIKYNPDGTEDWVYRYDNPEHTVDRLGEMVKAFISSDEYRKCFQ